MGRLGRPLRYDRFIFVTANLLRRRREESNIARIGNSLAGRRIAQRGGGEARYPPFGFLRGS